ncbi:MAG: DUF5312 family protein [Spirochaeta sp.]|jgi:hypothetical protein|nr:DUF5312 family protein [Spirochaeta sp.]
MRRTDRYTIPFPDVEIPPAAVYREAFTRFPVWYRWYIRLRALLSASSVETVTRRHHLHELRRTLASRSKQLIDPSVPALLTGFHDHIRALAREMQAIGPSLDEATGSARGSFLKVALADRDTRLNGVLERATHLSDAERDDPERSLADVRESVRQRMEELLTHHRKRIERVLAPVWPALRSLNVLARIELDTLLPVQGARREETPLRVVEHTLVNLYQATELCHRNTAPEATELAIAFARPRIRSSPRSARGIWIAIDAFRTEVPLRDIIRFSREEPFLTVPTIELKTDWWPPFARTWIDVAVERCGGELLEHRHRYVLDTLRQSFDIDQEPPVWIPSVLQPRTLGVLLLLAGSDLFQDTRRVITQLVIDATFYHLDTRNTLHQMALQLDQALERLVQILGSGDSRGTLGEEVQRLQQRSGPSSIVHRQLTTVYERHRPRIRTAIEESVEAFQTAGAIIGRTLAGRDGAFDLTDFHGQTFSSDLPGRELLQIVATTWLSLGRMVHGLYMLETTMSSQGGGRRRGGSM